MPRIVIGGNIGSGKTTQLGLLEKKGWEVRREPIDSWPLEEFYKDPKRWAFYFHMVILQTLRPLSTQRPIIYERSLLSSRWVFWPVLLKNGTVTQAEHVTYDKFYEHYAWYPDIYIFLAKDLDLAWEHIQNRGQAGDSGITKEYLADLGAEYAKLIKNVPCRVFIVNANRTAEEIHTEICQILAENELLVGDPLVSQVQKKSRTGWQVPCTPFTNMCSVS